MFHKKSVKQIFSLLIVILLSACGEGNQAGDQSDFLVSSLVSLSYSRISFSEDGGANDGSISQSILVDLSGDDFSVSQGELNSGVHYQLSGAALPVGLSFSIVARSSKQIEILVEGNASQHEIQDSLAGLLFSLTPEVFVKKKVPSDGSHEKNFSILFQTNPGAAPVTGNFSVALTANSFSEASINNGSIGNTSTINLTSENFSQNTGLLVLNTHYALNGTAVPAGLSLEIEVMNAQEAEIRLIGNANSHTANDSVTGISLVLLPAAFESGLTPSDASHVQALSVEFTNTTVTQVTLYSVGKFNGALGGRAGADAICKNFVPADVVVPNHHALLSVNANDEIRDLPATVGLPVDVPFVAKNGVVIAGDFSDLLDGAIDSDLASAGLMPSQADTGVYAWWWSGSNPSGALDSENCEGFTSNMPGKNGQFGWADFSNQYWLATYDSNGNSQGGNNCTTASYLVCAGF